ncbi:hypothetical protein [Agromyces sp. NPDC060279]|uniref:hypothetical protein n=1 Tax=Agromyces sp. NPDC060279 TaxID=3347092 RepID=UPI003651B351
MRLRARFSIALLLSFVFAGGFGGTYAALATASSSTVTIAAQANFCARVVAISNTDASERAQLNATAYNGCTAGSVSAKPSGWLGSSVGLKRPNGTLCSSAATTYSTAKTAYKSSMAYWNSSACGTRVQLSAAGIGYAYNGSGYTSRSVQAPFQVYP